MVPPPDEFPDFDNMSPEEQMAWLESLARRQGANADEFMTAADQDVPMPDDVEIDEPGYVPYSISEGARMERQEEEPPGEPLEPDEPTIDEEIEAEEAAEEEASDEFPPVVEDTEFQADAFEVAGDMVDADEPSTRSIADLEEEASDDVLDEDDLADPMQWLDSLAAHPEGDEDLFAALEEAGQMETFQPVDEAPEAPAEPAAQSEPVAAEAGVSSDELDFDLFEEFDLDDVLGGAGADAELAEEDLLGGEDPMKWLESLAVRQGADADELFTDADLDLPEIDETEPAEARAADEVAEVAEEPEEVSEFSAEIISEEDLLGGEDPMKWLESLARRQGANVEELVTEADLDIPEPPEGTVVDEPGYTEYSPFGILPPYREELPREALPEAPGDAAQEPAYPSELAEMGESLGWLSEMTGEPAADSASWLAVEDQYAEQESAEEPAPVSDVADLLGGMTDDEIEEALLRGELSGEQELAWLQRQARDQATARGEGEAAAPEEVEPAVPGEIPDWLQEMRDATPDEVIALEGEAEAPAEPGDVPDWLAEAAPTASSELEAQADELWAEAGELELEATTVDESELEAFLEGELAAEPMDQLAEALDAEYERRQAGDESEPEWYAEAVSEEGMPDAAAAEDEQAAEPTLAEAEPVDMPDWLAEPGEEETPAPEAEVPEWLSEAGAAAAESAGEMPEWLSETEQEDLSWMAEEVEEAAAEAPAVVPVTPEVSAPARAARIPDDELFASYRQRLEEEPADYASRLSLARALRTHGEIAPSLDHYELLIDNAQLLDDISHDLASLVDEAPQQPRARRLLGDTYMRRGNLQDALDAYRKALEQL